MTELDEARKTIDLWIAESDAQKGEIMRLEADRDAQVREAFMAGCAAMGFPESKWPQLTAREFAAFLARQRPDRQEP